LGVTTIRVVRRANTFTAKGMVLESMSMGEMRAGRESELGIVGVSVIGAKQSEAVRSIRWRTQ